MMGSLDRTDNRAWCPIFAISWCTCYRDKQRVKAMYRASLHQMADTLFLDLLVPFRVVLPKSTRLKNERL